MLMTAMLGLPVIAVPGSTIITLNCSVPSTVGFAVVGMISVAIVTPRGKKTEKDPPSKSSPSTVNSEGKQ